jgi:acyl CoA:acetate/3-ketoacid CoA transferase beta subunit
VDVTGSGLVLRELAPGATVGQVRGATQAPLVEAHDLREMEILPGA